MARSRKLRQTGVAALAAAALVALSACAPEGFPDAPLFADARELDAPGIAPLDTVLPADSARDIAATQADLTARGADLRARAEALRAREL